MAIEQLHDYAGEMVVERHLLQDRKVQEAYSQLTRLLQNLRDVHVLGVPSARATTLCFADGQIDRWMVKVNGLVDLERVSSLCRSMTNWPSVLDAGVTDFSDGSIAIRILTSNGIDMESLSRGLRGLRRDSSGDYPLVVTLIHEKALN